MNPSPIRVSSSIYPYLIGFMDIALVCLSGFLTYAFYLGDFATFALPSDYMVVVFSGSILLVSISPKANQSWGLTGFQKICIQTTATWATCVILLLTVFFATKTSDKYSRVWFIGWSISTLGGLVFFRLCVFSVLRWVKLSGINDKTLLVVGSGSAKNYVDQILSNPASVQLRKLAELEPDALREWLDRHLADGHQDVDEVWLCIPLEDQRSIKTALQALTGTTSNIRIVPDFYSLKMINHGVSDVMGIPMFDLSASPLTGDFLLAKVLEDYILATIILLLISPIMLVIAILIKTTSSGPVFFKQLRHGWNGEKFWVYKFRSMKVHAEKEGQVTQAKKNDTRVTPIGSFLRRTSLDELPQFINVLQGTMSIVGPRPHALSHNEFYKTKLPGYMLRHKVKPGITGWAQINGYRGETDTMEKMEKRVEYDVYYIENISIWLDLKIIFLTIFKGFVSPTAY